MTSMACCPLSGSDDSDQATFSSTVHPVARRSHRCEECDEVIPVGSKYERTSGRWDFGMRTFKTCLSCVEIRDHFACDGWLYGQVWSDIEENFYPDMKAGGPCMEGLSPEAKGRLFERRTKWLLERKRNML